MNIIVTGGTDGIGLALVRRLLNENHNVFIIGKNAQKGNKLLDTLKNPKLEFFQCDLSEKKEIKKLIKDLNKLPEIDVLINNAGSVFDKRLINNDGVEKTFALNHLSYFQSSRFCIYLHNQVYIQTIGPFEEGYRTLANFLRYKKWLILLV